MRKGEEENGSQRNRLESLVNIWQSFLFGGLTGIFLTDLINWRSESVGKDENQFAVINEAFRLILVDSNRKCTPVKLIVGYLCAIKGVLYKMHANNDLLFFLSCSRNLPHQCQTLTADELNFLSSALNILLDNGQPVSSLEKLVHGEKFDDKLEHNDRIPAPFFMSEKGPAKKYRHRPNRRNNSPSVEGNFASSLALKTMTGLLLKSFETFPFLQSLSLHQRTLHAFLKDLLDAQQALQAIRFYLSFPDVFSLEHLSQIKGRLEIDTIVLFAENLVWLFDFHHYYHHGSDSEPNSPFSSLFSPKDRRSSSEDKSLKSKQLRQQLKQAIQRRVIIPASDTPPALSESFLSSSLTTITTYVTELIQSLLSQETTLTFQAAELLAPTVPDAHFQKQIKELFQQFKLRKLVEKGGWQLASQKAYTLNQQLYLYDHLKQLGLYSEARTIYHEKRLDLSQVEPIQEEEIMEQRQKAMELYVPFPLTTIPIIMVDNIDTLQQMADEFEIPLLSAPSSPLSPPQMRSSRVDKTSQSVEDSLWESLFVEEVDIMEEPDGERSPNHSSHQDSAEKRRSSNGSSRANTLSRLVISNLVKFYQRNVTRNPGKEESSTSVIPATSTTTTATTMMITTKFSDPETLSETTETTTTEQSIVLHSPSQRFFRKVIGLDSEWKVTMYRQGDTADILQIATPDTVYIIDLYRIFSMTTTNQSRKSGNGTSPTTKQSWLQQNTIHLLRSIFQDKSILKLCFDLHQDLAMLNNVGQRALYPAMKTIHSLIDLKSEYHTLLQRSSTQQIGLSTVCERYLGKQLNKSMRLSDWSQRPLEASQLEYAALDAHSLIAIYDAIMIERGIDLGLHVYRRCYDRSALSKSEK